MSSLEYVIGDGMTNATVSVRDMSEADFTSYTVSAQSPGQAVNIVSEGMTPILLGECSQFHKVRVP